MSNTTAENAVSAPLKRTPLYQIHKQLGAKFGGFAGYEMPLFYPDGIITEHRHTRAAAGLFDICHMMHVEIVGPDADRLVSRLCPLDPATLPIGEARYNFFLNDKAGILDDLIITRLGPDRILIVCNAGCAQSDWAHINAHAEGYEVSVTRKTVGFIALQGPSSPQVLARKGIVIQELKFMTAMQIDDMFISRTGYTGEDGFEIAMPENAITAFVESLLEDDAVLAVGLGARDSLRLEAGLSLYGQDLDETITPMEAGLVWAIPANLRNGGGFIGADALKRAIGEGRKRRRVGLVPEGKVPVRAGAILRDATGRQIGHITSGGFGPSLDHPVALGLIATDSDENTLVAEVRGRQIPVKLAKLPFVPHSYKR